MNSFEPCNKCKIGGTRTGPRTHQERDFVCFNHEWRASVVYSTRIWIYASLTGKQMFSVNLWHKPVKVGLICFSIFNQGPWSCRGAQDTVRVTLDSCCQTWWARQISRFTKRNVPKEGGQKTGGYPNSSCQTCLLHIRGLIGLPCSTYVGVLTNAPKVWQFSLIWHFIFLAILRCWCYVCCCHFVISKNGWQSLIFWRIHYYIACEFTWNAMFWQDISIKKTSKLVNYAQSPSHDVVLCPSPYTVQLNRCEKIHLNISYSCSFVVYFCDTMTTGQFCSFIFFLVQTPSSLYNCKLHRFPHYQYLYPVFQCTVYRAIENNS